MGRRVLPALLVVTLAAGCGQKSGLQMKPVFPVQGAVLVNNKPAVGATVVFHPLPLAGPGAVKSHGKVGADGTFRLTTYNANDGAPEGEYAVTVYWPGKRVGKGADEDSEEVPPDQLGQRYSDPAASKIKIQIRAEETRLDAFQLR